MSSVVEILWVRISEKRLLKFDKPTNKLQSTTQCERWTTIDLILMVKFGSWLQICSGLQILTEKSEMFKFCAQRYVQTSYVITYQNIQLRFLATANKTKKSTSSEVSESWLRLKVKSDEDGMRLDRWVHTRYPSIPNSLIHKLLRNKKVQKNWKKIDEYFVKITSSIDNWSKTFLLLAGNSQHFYSRSKRTLQNSQTQSEWTC